VALALWGEPGIGKSHLARRILEAKALVDLLGTWLSARAPVVLLVEDLYHSAWREVWELLAVRVRRLRRVGLVVTSRTRPSPSFTPHRVRPLEKPELAQLLPSLPPEAYEWIYRHSRGNPLFALEYARLLQRQGHLWLSEGRWCRREPGPDPGYPVALEAVLSVALQPVWGSRPVATTLLALGLSGVWDDRAALARALGYAPEDLEEHMRALEDLGLLREGRPFHLLLVEVAVREDPALARSVARRLLSQLRDPPPALLATARLQPEAADWLERGGPGAQVLAATAGLLEDAPALLRVARALAHLPAQTLPIARKAYRLALATEEPTCAEARRRTGGRHGFVNPRAVVIRPSNGGQDFVLSHTRPSPTWATGSSRKGRTTKPGGTTRPTESGTTPSSRPEATTLSIVRNRCTIGPSRGFVWFF
jgi:hypothetical protein